MASYPGKRGIKLLISVSHAAKRFKGMSLGLRIARLIARLCLKGIVMGLNYSSKTSVVGLIWLLVIHQII